MFFEKPRGRVARKEAHLGGGADPPGVRGAADIAAMLMRSKFSHIENIQQAAFCQMDAL